MQGFNNVIMILGKSGMGKTYSLKNMRWDETFLVQIKAKPLPFRGWRKKLKLISKEDPNGNVFVTKSSDTICSLINKINETRPEIKCIVIDDLQYMMADELFRELGTRGKGANTFDAYVRIGKHLKDVLEASQNLRDDLSVILMAHTEIDDNMNVKMKTVGTLVDRQFSPEGLCNNVFLCGFNESKKTFHFIVKKRTESDIIKSLEGLFETDTVPNDLQDILDKIDNYNNNEE